MDLGSYTLPKLQQLKTRVAKEIERRESFSRESLLKQLVRMARDEGLSMDEVFLDVPEVVLRSVPRAGRLQADATPVKKAKVPAKYCHPSNRDLAWSGRGRRPAWVDAWLAGGGSMSALENAAETFARMRAVQIP